jgi:glycosyltransferase involved in cell wall biosynthesis
MSRVRILHLVEALGRGGLEQVVATLARRMPERYQVGVVALAAAGPVYDDLQAAGAQVRCLAIRDYYPRSVIRVARTLVESRPDIVHTHGHFAGVAGRFAARLVGVKAVIHHLHTTDTTLRRRHRRLENLLAAVSRRVLCCSEAVARHARIDLGLPDSLVEVVRNGIDPAPAPDRAAARRALGDPAAPLVACVGALTPHKGQAVLLAAWAATAKIGGTLVLVGDGPDRPALEAMAARLGIAARVLFTGRRDDVRALMPAFDLLVVPSVGREGLSLAALEAMDAGLPVVASRIGGLSEVVDHERSGLLVPPGDAGALTAALETLLSSPARARAFGEEGRRRVEAGFRAADMVRRIASIYEVTLDAVSRAA